MVDAALRPRPSFGIFLQSDNSMKDGLSYYEYQRLLRTNKVSLLQEKKERFFEPGYKKLTTSSSAGPLSRKVFQLKNKGHVDFKTAFTQPKQICESLKNPLNIDNISAHKSSVPHAQRENRVSVNNQSCSQIKARARMVKSATARDHQMSSHHVTSYLHKRPSTVGGVRDATSYKNQERDECHSQESQTEYGGEAACSNGSVSHKRALTDSLTHLVDLEDTEQNEKDSLIRAYTWRTSSQRAADEIGWNERVPSPSIPPPASTIEQFPDPVSMRLTFRRYHSEPAEWQSFGTDWDFVQSRTGNFNKGPQGIYYSSSSRKTLQIPGYHGHAPDNWMADTLASSCAPTFLIRSLKPRATNISRRGNIPSYTGCVHWTSVSPAHSNKPIPEPTTSARVHREIPLEEKRSPFARNGVFSKMVKTVSPHNPYNKIDY